VSVYDYFRLSVLDLFMLEIYPFVGIWRIYMIMCIDLGMYILEMYDLYPLRLLRYFIYAR
jgi:hypothetical protein